jgi:hypothetical protein
MQLLAFLLAPHYLLNKKMFLYLGRQSTHNIQQLWGGPGRKVFTSDGLIYSSLDASGWPLAIDLSKNLGFQCHMDWER